MHGGRTLRAAAALRCSRSAHAGGWRCWRSGRWRGGGRARIRVRGPLGGRRGAGRGGSVRVGRSPSHLQQEGRPWRHEGAGQRWHVCGGATLSAAYAVAEVAAEGAAEGVNRRNWNSVIREPISAAWRRAALVIVIPAGEPAARPAPPAPASPFHCEQGGRAAHKGCGAGRGEFLVAA